MNLRFSAGLLSSAFVMTMGIAQADTITFNANFTTQYYLTMNAGVGGSVSPVSGWTNSGAVVSINGAPTGGYMFTNWTGSGTGAYSGTNNPATIMMNGPITETGAFVIAPPPVKRLQFVQRWDDIEIDWTAGMVRNVTQNTEIAFEPLSRADRQMLEAGGLVPYLKQSSVA